MDKEGTIGSKILNFSKFDLSSIVPKKTDNNNNNGKQHDLNHLAKSVKPVKTPLSPFINALKNPPEQTIRKLYLLISENDKKNKWSQEAIRGFYLNIVYQVLVMKEKSMEKDIEIKKYASQNDKDIQAMFDLDIFMKYFVEELGLGPVFKELREEFNISPQKSHENKFFAADYGKSSREKEPIPNTKCCITAEVITPGEHVYFYNCHSSKNTIFFFKHRTKNNRQVNMQPHLLAHSINYVTNWEISVHKLVWLHSKELRDMSSEKAVEYILKEDDSDLGISGLLFENFIVAFADYLSLCRQVYEENKK